MFTGIINHIGEIQEIQLLDDGMRFWIATQFNDLVLGESIAVDGVCLTVMDIQEKCFACEVSTETLHVTTLSDCLVGWHVNLERALLLRDRLGGHLVSGHVDQIATVDHIINHREFTEVRMSGLAGDYSDMLVVKGSIAINGVSLTINQVYTDKIGVMLIPHTLEKTNLAFLERGSLVNIEYDQMAKLVAAQVKSYLQNAIHLTEEFVQLH